MERALTIIGAFSLTSAMFVAFLSDCLQSIARQAFMDA